MLVQFSLVKSIPKNHPPNKACTSSLFHLSDAHASWTVLFAAPQGRFPLRGRCARARRLDCLHRATLGDCQDRQTQVMGSRRLRAGTGESIHCVPGTSVLASDCSFAWFARPKRVDSTSEHSLYNEPYPQPPTSGYPDRSSAGSLR
jgi:hypothetical protein